MCTYTHSSIPKYTVQDVATVQVNYAPGGKKKKVFFFNDTKISGSFQNHP